MPVGGAIAGAAVIGGVATNRAANRTARAAETTSANNNALAGQIYAQNRATQTPYLQTGNRSMAAWASLMGLDDPPSSQAPANALSPGGRTYPGYAARDILSGAADGPEPLINGGPEGGGAYGPQVNGGPDGARSGFESFKRSLGYQTGLDEGNRALNLRLANRGQLLSGDAAREAVRFNTDYAQRWAASYLDRLMSGTILGAGAANALSGVGTNYSNAVAANNNNALNVQSGAWQQGAQGVSDLAGNAAGAFAYGYGNNWGRTPNALNSSYQQASTGYGRPLNW